MEIVFIMQSVKNLKIYNQLTPGVQEDAAECLRYLIARMENDYLRRNIAWENSTNHHFGETNPINRIFGGYFKNLMHCRNCGKRTNSDEDELFQELSLNIDFGLGTLNITKALKRFFGGTIWMITLAGMRNVGQEDIR
jgi:hypothetical protein